MTSTITTIHTPTPWKVKVKDDGTIVIAGTHKPNFHIGYIYGRSQYNPITRENLQPVPLANAAHIVRSVNSFDALYEFAYKVSTGLLTAHLKEEAKAALATADREES